MNGEKKDNFEIATRLCEHHTVIDLCNIIGKNAFIYLINIWMWPTRHGFHDGIFPDFFSMQDIELIAKWDGTPNKLSDALFRTGWVKYERGTNGIDINLVMKGITNEALGDIIFFKEEA